MKTRVKLTGEDTVKLILAGHHIKFEREYRFNSARMFRADFAIPEYRILIEVEGGTWGASSRHTTGKGFRDDCEKYNSACCLGWRVLRYTTDMLQENPGQVLSDVLCIIKSI